LVGVLLGGAGTPHRCRISSLEPASSSSVAGVCPHPWPGASPSAIATSQRHRQHPWPRLHPLRCWLHPLRGWLHPRGVGYIFLRLHAHRPGRGYILFGVGYINAALVTFSRRCAHPHSHGYIGLGSIRGVTHILVAVVTSLWLESDTSCFV
jgi:hypothetical protein